MFINPKIAIDEGWVSGIDNPDVQIQPNAIDFTLDKVFTISTDQFAISEEKKYMRGGDLLLPQSNDLLARDNILYNEFGDGLHWSLTGNSVYDGMSNVFVNLPMGVAAMLIIRSTFNRNGMFLTSGLYDSGFEGHLGFALHNRSSGYAVIQTGTRVGQVIFVASDSAGMYAGGWNHNEGTHYSENDTPMGPGSDD